jgi:xanthine dehydrogenase molybdopterin-binding subunit B
MWPSICSVYTTTPGGAFRGFGGPQGLLWPKLR